MGTFNIVVQGQVYGTVTTDNGYNTAEIIGQVFSDIKSGNLVIDATQPVGVSITPV